MKKILLAAAIMLGATGIKAQVNNENLVTKEVTVADFSAIDLNGAMNVYLSKGDKVGVRIEVDKKVEDKIVVETTDNTLYVKTKKGHINNVRKMNVYITYVNINSINNKLVGNLKSRNVISQNKLRFKSSAVGNTNLELDVENLEVDISAVGNTELTGKAVNSDLENTSVGNVRAGELRVDNMKLRTSAVGNLEYNAKNTVSLKSSGVGKVTNKANKETR